MSMLQEEKREILHILDRECRRRITRETEALSQEANVAGKLRDTIERDHIAAMATGLGAAIASVDGVAKVDIEGLLREFGYDSSFRNSILISRPPEAEEAHVRAVMLCDSVDAIAKKIGDLAESISDGIAFGESMTAVQQRIAAFSAASCVTASDPGPFPFPHDPEPS